MTRFGRFDRYLRPPYLIAILGIPIYFSRVEAHPLLMWDEGVYATVAQNMVREGYWLIPHLNQGLEGFVPFFQKPPLVFWLQAFAMEIIGVSVLAARLPSAVATILVAVLVFRMGELLYDWRSGVAGGMLFLVLPSVIKYGHSGSSASLDTPLVLFGSAFVWWAWRSANHDKYYVLAGLAAGLAVMTKGVAAGVFVFVLLPFLLIDSHKIYSTRALQGALISLIVISPWSVYSYIQFPNKFLQGLVFRQLSRARGDFQTYGDPLFSFMNFPYFHHVISNRIYAPFVFTVGLYLAWQSIQTDWERRGTDLRLVWWMIAPVLFFSLVGGNHGWYVLPMTVPMAVLLGRFTATIWTQLADSTGIDNLLDESLDVSYVIIGSVLVLAVGIIGYPLVEQPPPEESVVQQELGESLRMTPLSETIYSQKDIFESHNGHYVLEFYVDRAVRESTIDEMEAKPAIQYAVVSSESLSTIDREYTILKEVSDSEFIIVRFERKSARYDKIRGVT